MYLYDILRTETKTLLKNTLPQQLAGAGYTNIKRGNEFIYTEGRLPVLLVAHVDTVHMEPPKTIYHDKKHNVIWSPTGLGGDDRAGVYAILKIIETGHRPHVLFTDGEESGGTGALETIKKLSPPDVRMIIELDRQGSNDAVYYNCVCPELEEYINNFGFKTATGSFTDIYYLCPHWGVAGVNLSVGYYNAHTKAEYVKLDELEHTIERVKQMLDNLPDKTFIYKEKENLTARGYFDDSDWNINYCDGCGGLYSLCSLYVDTTYGMQLCASCYKKQHGLEPSSSTDTLDTYTCNYCGDLAPQLYIDTNGYKFCWHCYQLIHGVTPSDHAVDIYVCGK